jgi:NAD(P)-dependent dehydrogenase (short-subunit alcohol dehydrogenase family)
MAVGAVDVTDASQIAAAREELGDVPLAGLVNNAGIGVAAPLEFLPIDRLRQQLEVNLVGQAAVTQAFLPALRQARGRITTRRPRARYVLGSDAEVRAPMARFLPPRVMDRLIGRAPGG